MTPGIATWETLGPIEGPVLLIVNGPDHDEEQARRVLDALTGVTSPEAVHAVAPAGWSTWLGDRGLFDDRVLLSVDDEHRDVEINHFLLSSRAVRWIVPRRFRAFAGVVPHNLYNEEVQDVFEGQVSLLLRDGWLLAHTLPSSYVYVFDAAALMQRLGRTEAVKAYRSQAGRIVDALHETWASQGRPSGVHYFPCHDDVLAPLATVLDSRYLAFDENVPWPVALSSPVPPRAVAERLAAVVERVAAGDALLAEREQAVETLLAERNRAVELRDAILENERRRRLGSRLRRLVGRE